MNKTKNLTISNIYANNKPCIEECPSILPTLAGKHKDAYTIPHMKPTYPTSCCNPPSGPTFITPINKHKCVSTCLIFKGKLFEPLLTTTMMNVDPNNFINSGYIFFDSIDPANITNLWISNFTLSGCKIKCKLDCLVIGETIRLVDNIDLDIYNDFKITSLNRIKSGIIYGVTFLLGTGDLVDLNNLNLCLLPNLGSALNYPNPESIALEIDPSTTTNNFIGVTNIAILTSSYLTFIGSLLSIHLDFTGSISIIGPNSFEVNLNVLTTNNLFGNGVIEESDGTIQPVFVILSAGNLKISWKSTVLGAFTGTLWLTGIAS